MRTGGGGTERLLMLDHDLNAALELCADHILLEENGVATIDGLGTYVGHERRVFYTYSGGAFHESDPVTGFFTHTYTRPGPGTGLATAFCEAVREGFQEEAFSYLTPELAREVNFAALQDFLGNFQHCRPPLSNDGETLLGLIAQEGDQLQSARLYAFTFEGDAIADIGEI